jgi:hypothetical protein
MFPLVGVNDKWQGRRRQTVGGQKKARLLRASFQCDTNFESLIYPCYLQGAKRRTPVPFARCSFV